MSLHSNENSADSNSIIADLPAMSAAERAHSNQLRCKIIEKIALYDEISFADFMQMALYEPSFGYYVAGQEKFGDLGDFITAPEISPLFSYALGNQCLEVLRQYNSADILEIGAGSGKMAADLLYYLNKNNALPERYLILELSAELKQRQQNTLQEKVPQLLDKVYWVDDLERLFINGVVLANEVFDAMPVSRFCKGGHNIQELSVGYSQQSDKFVWHMNRAPRELENAIAHIENYLNKSFPESFVSEINLNLIPWFKSLYDCIDKGVFIAIDYGYARSEYYLNERCSGTLVCQYKQRAHFNPFINVGVQDISAYVDFTALVEAATAAGFDLHGYTTQANFLSACGLQSLYDDLYQQSDLQDQYKLANQVKSLVLPSEMGDRFKVMALTKDYDNSLCGFAILDYSNRL